MKKTVIPILLLLVLLLQPVSALPSMSGWAEPYYDKAKQISLPFPDELGTNITRGEFSSMLVGVYRTKFTPHTPKKNYFSDTTAEDVNICYELGLVNGVETNGDTIKFAPDNPIKRQELCKMLYGLLQMFRADYSPLPVVMLNRYPDVRQISPWAVEPVSVMLNEGIMTGLDDGRIAPLAFTSGEQAMAMSVRLCEKQLGIAFNAATPVPTVTAKPTQTQAPVPPSGTISGFPGIDTSVFPTRPPADDLIDLDSQRAEIESYGTVTSQEEAKQVLTTVTVHVWRMDQSGKKVASTADIEVHKAIKDRVWSVFEEIFNGEEKFPIDSVGGYSWRAPMSSGRLSEHNWGTAIDINADQNYCVYKDGSVIGEYWKPGEDPYSIKPDGEVVRIFRKYGFTWGGNAWDNPKDFMHFSYMGR